MKRLAFTPEVPAIDEPRRITEILESGWDMVHLRHPSMSLRDMRRLIEAIPQRLHSRLRLHGHFELLCEFNLGGIHLNRRCPEAPANYRGSHSRSCHSIEEIKESADCDYVTLSPVFNSISKDGYLAAFSEKDLATIDKIARSVVTTDVIALGGVTPGRLERVKTYGFDGFATLGALLGMTETDSFSRALADFNEAYRCL